MYLSKHIIYKTIFKQDDQIETVEYKAKGILHMGKKKRLNFSIPEHVIDITFDDKEISLQHDQSLLNLHIDKEIWNDYLLPYGQIALKTKVLKFQTNDEYIKLKYELYDQNGIISTTYIMITMLPFIE